MNNTLHTKWGTAKLQKSGYYVITSYKEGNNNKRLHRLIWEDFYGCKVPEGYIIHHKNFDKKCNCILNLQLMKEKDHRKLHTKDENHPNYGKNLSKKTREKISESHKGKKQSEETKLKRSKSTNTTGIFRVSKVKNDRLKNGFAYRYIYYDEGKYNIIESVSIEKLEAKVKAKGLLWRKFDDEC